MLQSNDKYAVFIQNNLTEEVESDIYKEFDNMKGDLLYWLMREDVGNFTVTIVEI